MNSEQSYQLSKFVLGAFIGATLVTLFCLPALTQDEVRDKQTRGTFTEPRRAYGPDEYKVHVGLELGFAEPGERYNAGAEYGANVGFQPIVPIGLGLEVATLSTSQVDTGVSFDRTKVMLNGTYNFGGNLPVIRHSYLGAGLGPVYDTIGSASNTYLGINLLAGADFPLISDSVGRNSFSLGAVAKYLIVTEDAQDSFALNAQLKYWF